MLDTLIQGATVVDGTGSAPFSADVGLQDGKIVQIGRITQAAHDTVHAHGAVLTPGFVDIHTHYDGQLSWDANLRPSIDHGTTTALVGNCGVGFAPVRPGSQAQLIRLMEGVEEIPGAALAEGIHWAWETFVQYMDALDTPHTLNHLHLVPHDCLRYYVMGERAAQRELASAHDCRQMQALLHEALAAGALGFSTGRSDNHRTSIGEETPASIAQAPELLALAAAFDGLPYRILHAVSDFDALQGASETARARFDAEYQLLHDMARVAKRPLALTWLERLNAPEQWKWLAQAATDSQAAGVDIKLQTATRAIGVMSGLDTSFCVLTPFVRYQAIAHLPLPERAARLREPEFRAALLADQPLRLADGHTAIPPIVDHIMATLAQTSHLMFELHNASGEVDYEPDPATSFGARAHSQGVPALALLYDYLASGDGSNLVYFPIFNYLSGNLSTVETMLSHPLALASLGDAGAHVGTVCDASNATTLLSHWVKKRQKMPLEHAVHLLTQRNARHLGLHTRGSVQVGQTADLNLIDLNRLAVKTPQLVRDLPAGGKRILQGAHGYLGTWVAGKLVCANGELTGQLPGGLIRAAQK